jgi:hypothetical protein
MRAGTHLSRYRYRNLICETDVDHSFRVMCLNASKAALDLTFGFGSFATNYQNFRRVRLHGSTSLSLFLNTLLPLLLFHLKAFAHYIAIVV